jgi:hypothetical protein
MEVEMAKFNLELEIDWIDEESNLDETVKQEIMRSIEERVVSKVRTTVLEKAEESIVKRVDDLVTEAIKEKIEQFLTTPRDITDRYGDVIKENVTVESLFKEKMESAFSKKTLDKDGNTGGYSNTYSIVEFITQKGMDALVDERVKELAKDAKILIEETVAQKIKTNIADGLTEMILENSTALKLKDKTKE